MIGGKPVPFIVNPYVGRDGQVFAPVDAVHLLGAEYVPDEASHTVAVSGPGGKSITVPFEQVGGVLCPPTESRSGPWRQHGLAAGRRRLSRARRMLMVRQDGDALAIYTSYPVYYHVQRLDSPNRVFVDLYGLDLAALPAAIPVSGGNVLHVRSGQMGYNTVRIVNDLRKSVPFRVESPTATREVRVALGVGEQAPVGGPASSPVAPMPIPPPVKVVQREPPNFRLSLRVRASTSPASPIKRTARLPRFS